MSTIPVRLATAPLDYDQRYFNLLFGSLWTWLDKLSGQTQLEVAATAVTTVTANYVVGLSDGLVLASTTGSSVTTTLPDATIVLGREFTVKRTTAGANTLTVQATAGNIDADASFTIDVQYEAHTFKSDGSNYWIVSSHYGP